MATSGMQTGQVVGTVKGINGTVTAVNANGVIRTLKVGDKVFAGEKVQTANGATAQIDFVKGGFATIGADQTLPLDGAVLGQAAEAAKPMPGAQVPAATSDADVEKLQKQVSDALAKGEDPTQLLEAAAAGATGGTGGAEEGGSFVVVQQNAARGAVTPGHETGTFGYPIDELPVHDGRERPDGDFNFDIQTVYPDADGNTRIVGYAFEDAQPNRYASDATHPEQGDRSINAAQILFEFTPRGTTVVDNVHLEGFPPGSKVYIGDPNAGGVEQTANADGSYDFKQVDFTGKGVFVVPPGNDDADIDIHARLDLSVNGGGTRSIEGDFTIVVDAVADRPENVKGEGEITHIDGMLGIDGMNIKETLKDGWAKTEINKTAGVVDDSNVKVTGKVHIEATFYDTADGSEKHTLYIEKPDTGKLGFINQQDKFEEFGLRKNADGSFYQDKDGNFYYEIPQGQMHWGPDTGPLAEPGSAKATVDCVFEADGKDDVLNNDVDMNLKVLAKAEETTFDGAEPDTDNNVSFNDSTLEGKNAKFTIDSIDSTLTIKAGWASEDNSPGKHIGSNASYAPNPADMKGDTDVDSDGVPHERGVDGVEADSTAGQSGAPVTLSISGSTNGQVETLSKVEFKFPDGELLKGGSAITSGSTFAAADGNTYKIDISGNDVTITKVGGTAAWTSLDGLGLTFKPTGGSHSDTDLSFTYKVTVEAASGAGAEYTGKGLIVVDAVADLATVSKAGIDYNGGTAASTGQTIDISSEVTFKDLQVSEHKYVVFNIYDAVKKGWTVDSGIDMLSKNEVNNAFQTKGGDDLPVSGTLHPHTNDTTDEYVLMEVVSDGAGGWTVVGVHSDGSTYTIPGAKVTEVNGKFTVSMEITAPGVDAKNAEFSTKAITVVDQADALANGGQEYDYDNNIAISNTKTDHLKVSGVHSDISLKPAAVYEGSQPNKNMGDMGTVAGGKIELSLVEDGNANNAADKLDKIVFQYDDSHGKITLGSIVLDSGDGIVFTYDANTGLYTKAEVFGADGVSKGAVTAPGQTLETITAGLKYTPTTGDVSDTDVDIEYVASIIDSASGAMKIAGTPGTWDALKNAGNDTVAKIAAEEAAKQANGKATVHDNAAGGATVVVDAVADKPAIGTGKNAVDYGKNEAGANNTAAGNGDKVTIKTNEITFKDYTDGSEKHSLLISNLPVATKDGVVDATLPDQTIKLTGGNGGTLELVIEGGKIVSIGGVTVNPAIDVKLVTINDTNAGAENGKSFYKIDVPNDFLQAQGGKVVAEVTFQLPKGITTDQSPAVKVGGMAEETGTDTAGSGQETNTKNNTSYTFQDGSIAINVSNAVDLKATAGYEDGWKDQNTVDHSKEAPGSNHAVITVTTNASDHILGTKTGETGQPITVEFKFAGGDAKLGTFTYNGHTYSLGSGVEKTADGYKLTIPAADLPAKTATGSDSAAITYKPVGNDDTDLTNVKVTMSTHADTSTDTGEQTATINTVTIDAVADLPIGDKAGGKIKAEVDYGKNVDQAANTAAKIGSEFAIKVTNVSFFDYQDGSEKHSLLVQKTGINGTYDAGGATPVVALADLGNQTITINGGNGWTETVTVANGTMSITVSDGTTTTTYSSGSLPAGWTAADWTAAQTALVKGGTLVNGPDGNTYFKIPVLNEFLDKTGGKVADAQVSVKLPDGTNITKDADLTVKTGAMADDKPTDTDTADKNNQAYNLDNTKVDVGVVTSQVGVEITSKVISENLTPTANTAYDAPQTAGADIVIKGIAAGETAEVTLTFDLMNGNDIPASVNPGDQMRVEFGGKEYVATQNGDGTWSCKVPVEGLANGGNQTLEFKPGFNFNSQDIKVTYSITVADNASGAEKTWQNTDSTGGTGTYQDNKLGIVVDAVAQKPAVADAALDVPAGATHVEAGEPFNVKATVTFQDVTDGSELHYVLVEANTLGIQPTALTYTAADGTTKTITITEDMYQSYDGKQWFKVPVSDADMKVAADGKGSLDVKITFQTDSGSQNGIIKIGAMSVENHDAFNLTTNQETNIKNNIAVSLVSDVGVKFSHQDGYSKAGGVIYEDDRPSAHTGSNVVAGGAEIKIDAVNAVDKVTAIKFTYDAADGTLYKLTDAQWNAYKADPSTNLDAFKIANGGETAQPVSGEHIVFIPAKGHGDKDVNISFKVTILDGETKQSHDYNDSVKLVKDAVAELPVAVSGQAADVVDGHTVDLLLKGTFQDFDGSEAHYLLVEAKPNSTLKLADGTLITQTYTHVVDDGTGKMVTKVYYLVPADGNIDPATGKASVMVQYHKDGHILAGDGKLAVGALAVDNTTGDGEATYHNNQAFAAGADVDVYWGTGGSIPLWIDPVYEDNMPNAHVGDMTPAGGAAVSFAGAPAYAETVEIKIPAGQGTLTGAGVGVVNPDGSITYTIAKDGSGNWPAVKFDPSTAVNSDTDVTISYEYKNGGGQSPDGSRTFQVIVDAVADKPVGTDAGGKIADVVAAGAGQIFGEDTSKTVKVPMTVTFNDYLDGSEQHYILIEQIPGVTVVGSTGTIVIDGKSYIQLSVDNADIASKGVNGKITVDVEFKVDPSALNSDNVTKNADGSYSIKVDAGAMAQETSTGSGTNMESRLDNNTAVNTTGSVELKVSVVDSVIGVSVQGVYENDQAVDGGVAVGGGVITVSGLQTGKSDVMTEFKLTVDDTKGSITGLDPAKVAISHDGTKTTYTITDAEYLAKINSGEVTLKFVPAGHDSTDTAVTWSAKVKDTLSGDVKDFGTAAKVVVDAVGNAPAVSGVDYESAGGKPAAKAGEKADVKVHLDFDDNDGSETHYAVLEQSTNITCNTATVNGAAAEVITVIGKDGTLYYGVKVPVGVSAADVLFKVEARDTKSDIADTLKVGGISAEKNLGYGADKELTLDNNWSENVGNTINVRIGAVETTAAKLANVALVEDATGAVPLNLTAADGSSLQAQLTANHEKITGVTMEITQSGAANGATIGYITYDGKDFAITVSGGKATVALDNIPAGGLDLSKLSIKMADGYHNNNDLTIKTKLTVTDDSGATGTIDLTSKATIAATADAATGLTVTDSSSETAVAGHFTQTQVNLKATFADVDGSEAHSFLVKVANGVTVTTSGATLVTDVAAKLAAGFAAGDTVYKVNASSNTAANIDQNITLKVPETAGSSGHTDVTVVAVSTETGTIGAGGTKDAYSAPKTVSVDTLTNPNIDGAVNASKAAADILDTARGHDTLTGKTLLPAGYVTDADGDAIKIADITNGTQDPVTKVWTVTGTYGTWTVQANGSYTYELKDAYKAPNALPVGKEDVLKFTVTDGKGWTSAELTNTLTLDKAPNVAPTAPDASVSKVIADAINGSFSFKDTNQDQVALEAVLAGAALLPGSWNGDHTVYTVVGEHGTLKVSGTPDHVGDTTTYSYTYEVNESGLAAGDVDHFTFKGSDGFGGTVDAGKLDITLTGIDYTLKAGVNDGSGVFGWNAGANIHGDMDSGLVKAGAGVDKITVAGDHNMVHGGDGNDTISVTGDHNTIHGDGGNDIISVSGNLNFVYGDAGDDVINVTGTGNTVYGGAGSDTINLLSGHGQTTIGYLKADMALETGDKIDGFKVAKASAGGDVLDISDLLTGAGLGDNKGALIDGGYLKFENVTQGSDGKVTAILSVDADGSGSGAAVKLATITMDGVGPLTGDAAQQAHTLLDQLVNNDQIKF